jgi:hypothetical protein
LFGSFVWHKPLQLIGSINGLTPVIFKRRAA